MIDLLYFCFTPFVTFSPFSSYSSSSTMFSTQIHQKVFFRYDVVLVLVVWHYFFITWSLAWEQTSGMLSHPVIFSWLDHRPHQQRSAWLSCQVLNMNLVDSPCSSDLGGCSTCLPFVFQTQQAHKLTDIFEKNMSFMAKLTWDFTPNQPLETSR